MVHSKYGFQSPQTTDALYSDDTTNQQVLFMFTIDGKNMTADRKNMLQEVYLFMFTVEAVCSVLARKVIIPGYNQIA